MNLFKSLPKTLQTLSLLFVFPLMLQQHTSTVAGPQRSEQSEANRAMVYADQDSYQIYAGLLESEKHSLYVIRTEIHGYADLTRKNLGIKGDRDFMQKWGAVMDDYAKQNRTAKLLKKNFSLHASYELIPESNIFPDKRGQNGWDDFYRRYPSSDGFYWFSAVGFNSTRTRAIVGMGHECGTLCGNGGPHFFEKKAGKWCEVSVKTIVSVWAS